MLRLLETSTTLLSSGTRPQKVGVSCVTCPITLRSQQSRSGRGGPWTIEPVWSEETRRYYTPPPPLSEKRNTYRHIVSKGPWEW